MGPYLTSFIKSDYRWTKVPWKYESIKLQEENVGDCLCHLSRVEGFHKQDTECRLQKVKKLKVCNKGVNRYMTITNLF